MKHIRRMVFFLLFFSFWLSSFVTASAEDLLTMDSVDFSEEEKNLYRDSSETQVIKIYPNAGFRFYILNRVPYATVFTTEAFPFVIAHPVYMAISPNGDTEMKQIKTDKYLGQMLNRYMIGTIYSDWESVYQYALTPSLIFGETKVYNTYCVDTDFTYTYNMGHEGQHVQRGLYICYVTAKGDFFLHKKSGENDTLYVLTEEEMRNHCMNDDFDLEPYRLENFSLELKEPEGQEPLPGEPTEQETPTTDALNTQTPADENASPAWYVWALTALGGAVIGAGGAVMIGTVRRKKKE